MIKTIFQHVVICAVSVLALACSAGQTDGAGNGDNMALELRNMILSTKPEASATDRNPSVVIMDVHTTSEEITSVMSATGGDASIYLSSGGAMIGGGEHENVRSAAVSFAAEALKQKATMTATTDFPYPAAGQVRFYLRTREGAFVVEAPEAELAAGTHPLSELFRRGQAVVTQFRTIRGT